MVKLRTALVLAVGLLGALRARAAPEAARFDLIGPKVDVRVTRAGKTLPIASVPNLEPGDSLWLHPDLPPTQSVRYLMVVAFLRGTTNPPPDDWFVRIETWQKKVREEGVEVKVPADAQQVVLFLAPATGGDFSTLRSAVRGRPGVFVRATQDLNQAGFEQARIEKYLAAIAQVPPGDAKQLQDHSNLLARTLALRPNPDCFKREVDQQLICLTQSGSQTLLDDGHGQTIAAALTTGASSDFITAASYTQAGGGGTYSAYVGAVVDLGRLLTSLHTAQYQYIPAIAFPQQESLNLRLNTPPSFLNPKSVIVIGLPSIQKSSPPPLRASDEKRVTCLLKSNVAIPVDGAPLVFSTGLAHDLVLHLDQSVAGSLQDLPLRADAYQGGLVLATTPRRYALADAPPSTASIASHPLVPSSDTKATGPVPAEPVSGTIKGFWGFDAFEGPAVLLQQTPGKNWKVLSGEPLIAGREDHIVLSASGAACVASITFDSGHGAPAPVLVKTAAQPNTIDASLPLSAATPGTVKLAIHQYGTPDVDSLEVKTYSEPAKLGGLTFHAGDRTAILSGERLDQVRQLRVNDFHFAPVPGSPPNALSLTLSADSPLPAFHPGDQLTAHVGLDDGRFLDLPLTVSPPRPTISLRSRSTPHAINLPIQLAAKDDLPVNQPITLILKSTVPIPRNEQIEVATQDGSLTAKLDFNSGALVLQDAHTLRVTFDPLKVLGPSVFGPARFRAVEPGTDPGDWILLATFVRLPILTSLGCPQDQAKPCTLTGSSLFLIDSLAQTEAFADAVPVPEDFADSAISVPHPVAGMLYLRLRDDRASLATLSLPIQPEPASTRSSVHGAGISVSRN